MQYRTLARPARFLAALLVLTALLGLSLPGFAQEQLGVVMGGKLHLRESPSHDAKVLATYENGTHVKVLDVSGEWYHVEVADGKTGYMEARYIFVTSSGVVANGNNYVNLRNAPSRNAKVLGQYDTGTLLTMLSEDGSGWIYVDINGVQGYMGAQFIQPAEDDVIVGPLAQGVLENNAPDEETSLLNTKGDNSVVHQYGTGESKAYADDTLMFTIYYPVTGIAPMDEALEKWVDSVIADANDEAAEAIEEGAQLEITIQYDSYFLANRYVGVLETGLYDSNMLAHPVDLIYTVNADLQTGGLLAYTDIFVQEHMGDVVSLLEAKLGGDVLDMVAEDMPVDETWLQYSLLSPDGVAVILPRGEYLPMSAGSIVTILGYEELAAKGLLAIEVDTAQAPVQPQQEPAAQEAPADASQRVIDPTKPMIALTFDDGPGDYTQELVELFAKYDARATFYMVGNRIENYSDAVRAVVAQGSEIGTHTWSHKQLTKLSRDGIRSEIQRGMDAITAVTGQTVHTMRPPYGAHDEDVHAVCRELGLAIATWSIDTEDWKTKDADATYRAIMNHVKSGSIILCHETKHSTLNAMKRVVPELIEKGYQLVTVSELLSFSHTHGEPGLVYYHLDTSKMDTGN